MKWTPEAEWKDQDAIIIGGGSSLLGFDFNQLKGQNVIGCNDAFHLGGEIVKFVIFGDASWWHRNKWALEREFNGRLVSCAPSLFDLAAPKLLQMQRTRDGLHHGNLLGWNYSTGAAAINLAVTLGATTIYLLGYDLGAGVRNKTHWHNYGTKPTNLHSFTRFIRGFKTLAQALASQAPQVKVLNVTDGSSNLPVFDRITFEELPRLCLDQD